MDAIQVMEYQINYPIIDLELSKDKKEYDRAIISLYVAELNQGCVVKKINKPTKSGTKVTFKPCETEEEQKDYIKLVNLKIDLYEKEYNKKLGFRIKEGL